jgi:hypothetical protein
MLSRAVPARVISLRNEQVNNNKGRVAAFSTDLARDIMDIQSRPEACQIATC